MSAKAVKNARELLLKEYQGALATQSQALPGYPFGSFVPYCLDEQGLPLILISRIAQHTRNLRADSRCSLLLGRDTSGDVQAAARLTLLAQAKPLEAEAVQAAAERYYRCFPQAENYHETHDFDFWRLEPVRWRYIGGFGAIHWLDEVALPNPFGAVAEAAMLAHMNQDHRQALAHYVRLAGLPEETAACMVGIDSEGFRLRIGARLFWLPFSSPCHTEQQVRQALVALAKAPQLPGVASVNED